MSEYLAIKHKRYDYGLDQLTAEEKERVKALKKCKIKNNIIIIIMYYLIDKIIGICVGCKNIDICDKMCHTFCEYGDSISICQPFVNISHQCVKCNDGCTMFRFQCLICKKKQCANNCGSCENTGSFYCCCCNYWYCNYCYVQNYKTVYSMAP
eukprot:454105_1